MFLILFRVILLISMWVVFTVGVVHTISYIASFFGKFSLLNWQSKIIESVFAEELNRFNTEGIVSLESILMGLTHANSQDSKLRELGAEFIFKLQYWDYIWLLTQSPFGDVAGKARSHLGSTDGISITVELFGVDGVPFTKELTARRLPD